MTLNLVPMKSFYCIFLSFFFSLALSAQTSMRLEDFHSMFADSNVEMDISYEIEMKSASSDINPGVIKGEASLSIQGNLYSMNGSGVFILCDGKAVRIMDPSAKEVIYEPVYDDVRDGGYMVNPTVLFSRMDDFFKLDKMISDSTSDSYSLVAQMPCGMETCRLDFNKSTGRLTYAEFVMSDENIVKVRVNSFKNGPLLPESEYALPDPSSYSADWVVTDLR